jgi:hypothetical protein
MTCALINSADMIGSQARIFDDLRSGDAVCYLIKRIGQTKRFSIVLQPLTGWFVSWDKFRESMVFRYATADTAFADILAQSSYLAYGLPDGDGAVDIYEISPDKRDKVPPSETNPSWKIFVIRFDEERFTP